MNFAPMTEEGARLAGLVDHTLLKQDAAREQVATMCKEARHYGFASVCVNPCMVSLAAKELAGSSVKTCTVIGFPLGAATTASKAFEVRDAVKAGAEELDMVLNVSALKAGDLQYIQDDVRAVVAAAHGLLVKVILETCLLTDPEKVAACEQCVAAGASFVKTSTGFAGGGATVEDIRLMRETVGPDLGVKASGGVRTLEDARAMVEAGANRIGTSRGVAIVT